ncbi:hypothetical protein F5148DRAFT_1284463 [Russula earlei]|uniref:Uncharacterized protein n=1 Tax=Russula earlei TaxID=71964 RepID=A0ACC0UA07_9AGAM|nr:hypothetical protein F5148DRAFT_1284463 [Russula earlei]
MILVQRVLLGIRAGSCGYCTTSHLRHRISHLLTSIRRLDSTTRYSSPWKSVASLPTLDSALAELDFLTALDTVHPPPTWLLVALCSKVRSPADATKASHLIITNLPHVPSPLRPSVLILVVHLLATYRALPELDRVVNLFIGLPLHQHSHFNQLLRALTLYTHPRSDGLYLARLVVLLLKTMKERELSLSRKTYRVLLQNRYITMELTEEIRQRIIRDKIVPDRTHLESLLRIFTHHNSVDDAIAYVRAIHRLDQRREEPSHLSTQTRPRDTDQIVPSATVEYLAHLVHENSQRSKFNADAEWSQFLKTGLSPRFSGKQNTSAAAWAARLLSLSLLHGLLQKRAHALALEVWERYREHGTRKLRLDPVALNIGVEVLTRAGNSERALALIESVTYRPMAHRTSKHSPSPSLTVGRSTVPASAVVRFMRVLSMTNPSAALRLWEHMGILYDATPDALAFTAMLDAARHATLNGESFAGAMQELGFDFRFRLPFSTPEVTVEPQLGAESLDRARRRSYETLKASLAVDEGDMWGNERAWRRAHRIFRSALLAGWPALANVRAPARAVRASGETPATAPLRDLRCFLVPEPESAEDAAATSHDDDGHDDDDDDDDDPLLRSPPLLSVYPRAAYPSFAPDDATFRAAVLLLGAARAASEIPQTLAWMRALGIAPRTRTLAYALVFWAEVSVGAPLLERLRGGRSVEYLRLVRWMQEWVGVENVPTEAAVGEAMRRVDAMRRRRDRSVGGQM